jgi:hypothetical protein
MRTGLTSKTIERLILDAGALYRNLDPTEPEENWPDPIGATRGGSTFSVEMDLREIEVDGVRGPTMGLRRPIRHVATLQTTLMEVSEQLFTDLTLGTAAPVSGTDFIEVTPSNVLSLDSFVDNISLVADIMNTEEPAILQILNTVPEGEWSLSMDDEDEGTIEVTFMSHYDFADPSDVPYRIWIPSSIEGT